MQYRKQFNLYYRSYHTTEWNSLKHIFFPPKKSQKVEKYPTMHQLSKKKKKKKICVKELRASSRSLDQNFRSLWKERSSSWFSVSLRVEEFPPKPTWIDSIALDVDSTVTSGMIPKRSEIETRSTNFSVRELGRAVASVSWFWRKKPSLPRTRELIVRSRLSWLPDWRTNANTRRRRAFELELTRRRSETAWKSFKIVSGRVTRHFRLASIAGNERREPSIPLARSETKTGMAIRIGTLRETKREQWERERERERERLNCRQTVFTIVACNTRVTLYSPANFPNDLAVLLVFYLNTTETRR